MPTVPIAIIWSIVMSAVAIAIAIVGSIAVTPVIIDFLHSTMALGKWQNAGLRGSRSR
jgi:hypothetical protein